MAIAHSLPVVLPSVHPKAAPALPTAAALPQPTGQQHCHSPRSSPVPRPEPATLGGGRGAPAQLLCWSGHRGALHPHRGHGNSQGTRSFPGDTELHRHFPGVTGLPGGHGASQAFPGGHRAPQGAQSSAGRGQGQPGSAGISAVTGEGHRAKAVPVSGESSLARHGHGFPGTAQPGTRSARGTCEGTAAIREGPERGSRRSDAERSHRESPASGAGGDGHSPGTRLGCTGLLRDRPEHGGTGRPAALGPSGREAV